MLQTPKKCSAQSGKAYSSPIWDDLDLSSDFTGIFWLVLSGQDWNDSFIRFVEAFRFGSSGPGSNLGRGRSVTLTVHLPTQVYRCRYRRIYIMQGWPCIGLESHPEGGLDILLGASSCRNGSQARVQTLALPPSGYFHQEIRITTRETGKGRQRRESLGVINWVEFPKQ